MASSVSASNVDTLLFLRDGFARYATKMEEIVRALEIELRHVLEEWDGRVQKARRQERECRSDLDEALRDLRWCESSGDKDAPPNCSYEQERVEKAKRALAKAQSRLQLVSRGAREIQEACEAFQKHGRALRLMATQTAPSASSHINALLRDVERHSFITRSATIAHAPTGVSLSLPLLNPPPSSNKEASSSSHQPQTQRSASMRALAVLLRGQLAPPSPPDASHIELAAQRLSSVVELKPAAWENRSESQHIAVLGSVEQTMAELQGRPPVTVVIQSTDSNVYSSYDPQRECISLSHFFVLNASPRELVDAIVHQGRHAYQAYAIHHRTFHPDQEEVDRWRINNLYYLSADIWGDEAYRNQPVERDAFAYTEAVLRQLYGEAR